MTHSNCIPPAIPGPYGGCICMGANETYVPDCGCLKCSQANIIHGINTITKSSSLGEARVSWTQTWNKKDVDGYIKQFIDAVPAYGNFTPSFRRTPSRFTRFRRYLQRIFRRIYIIPPFIQPIIDELNDIKQTLGISEIDIGNLFLYNYAKDPRKFRPPTGLLGLNFLALRKNLLATNPAVNLLGHLAQPVPKDEIAFILFSIIPYLAKLMGLVSQTTTDIFQHYLDNTGDDFHFDYEQIFNEKEFQLNSNSTHLIFNTHTGKSYNIIRDHVKQAVSQAARTDQKFWLYSNYLSGFGSQTNGKIIVGAHSVILVAEVSKNNIFDYDVKVSFISADRWDYNKGTSQSFNLPISATLINLIKYLNIQSLFDYFDEDTKTVRTGISFSGNYVTIPDDSLGRFEALNWASGFRTIGTYDMPVFSIPINEINNCAACCPGPAGASYWDDVNKKCFCDPMVPVYEILDQQQSTLTPQQALNSNPIGIINTGHAVGLELVTEEFIDTCKCPGNLQLFQEDDSPDEWKCICPRFTKYNAFTKMCECDDTNYPYPKSHINTSINEDNCIELGYHSTADVIHDLDKYRKYYDDRLDPTSEFRPRIHSINYPIPSAYIYTPKVSDCECECEDGFSYNINGSKTIETFDQNSQLISSVNQNSVCECPGFVTFQLINDFKVSSILPQIVETVDQIRTIKVQQIVGTVLTWINKVLIKRLCRCKEGFDSVFDYDNKLIRCDCPNHKIYNTNTDECVCPYAHSIKPSSSDCQCDAKYSFSNSNYECECAEGLVRSSLDDAEDCDCPQGFTLVIFTEAEILSAGNNIDDYIYLGDDGINPFNISYGLCISTPDPSASPSPSPSPSTEPPFIKVCGFEPSFLIDGTYSYWGIDDNGYSVWQNPNGYELRVDAIAQDTYTYVLGLINNPYEYYLYPISFTSPVGSSWLDTSSNSAGTTSIDNDPFNPCP